MLAAFIAIAGFVLASRSVRGCEPSFQRGKSYFKDSTRLTTDRTSGIMESWKVADSETNYLG